MLTDLDISLQRLDLAQLIGGDRNAALPSMNEVEVHGAPTAPASTRTYSLRSAVVSRAGRPRRVKHPKRSTSPLSPDLSISKQASLLAEPESAESD